MINNRFKKKKSSREERDLENAILFSLASRKYFWPFKSPASCILTGTAEKAVSGCLTMGVSILGLDWPQGMHLYLTMVTFPLTPGPLTLQSRDRPPPGHAQALGLDPFVHVSFFKNY